MNFVEYMWAKKLLSTPMSMPNIKQVLYRAPATIVFWDDGTKTVVTCQKGDTYSEEMGLAMAISKKAYGNKGSFNKIFDKWLSNKR